MTMETHKLYTQRAHTRAHTPTVSVSLTNGVQGVTGQNRVLKETPKINPL